MKISRGCVCLKVKKIRHNTVEITYRDKTGVKKSNFQGVIISSPGSLGFAPSLPVRRHFHSYISILFEFEKKPRIKNKPKVDLCDGLYTDDRLVNYLEVEDTKRNKRRWVLRILIPDAKKFIDNWPDEKIADHCEKILRKLDINVEPHPSPSIKPWKNGLPCGGTTSKYEKVSERIYLCGDRYGRWPSMAAAIVSGAWAADAVLNDLTQ